jgi:hypothetical protein
MVYLSDGSFLVRSEARVRPTGPAPIIAIRGREAIAMYFVSTWD